MKTKEYIKHFNLNPYSKGFDYEEFTFHFVNEFESRLEWYSLKGQFTSSKWKQSIKEMNDKWDAIFNKAPNAENTGLLQYIKDAYFYPLKEQYLPELHAQEQMILGMNVHELRSYIDDRYYDTLRFVSLPGCEYTFNEYEAKALALSGAVGEFNFKGILTPSYSLKSLQSKVNSSSSLSDFDIFVFQEFDDHLWRIGKSEYVKYIQKISLNKKQYQEEQEFRFNFSWEDVLSIFKKNLSNQKLLECMSILSIRDHTELDTETVKKQYKILAQRHHPDKGGNQEVFIQITEAKNSLLNYLKS